MRHVTGFGWSGPGPRWQNCSMQPWELHTRFLELQLLWISPLFIELFVLILFPYLLSCCYSLICCSHIVLVVNFVNISFLSLLMLSWLRDYARWGLAGKAVAAEGLARVYRAAATAAVHVAIFLKIRWLTFVFCVFCVFSVCVSVLLQVDLLESSSIQQKSVKSSSACMKLSHLSPPAISSHSCQCLFCSRTIYLPICPSIHLSLYPSIHIYPNLI